MQAFSAVIERVGHRQGSRNPFVVNVTPGIRLDDRNGHDLFGRTLQGVILRAGDNRRTVTLAPNAPPKISKGMVTAARWRRGQTHDEIILAADIRPGRAVVARLTLPDDTGLQVAWQPGDLHGATSVARVLAYVKSTDEKAFDLLVVLNTLTEAWTADLYEEPSDRKWRVYLNQNRTIHQEPNVVGRLVVV